MNEPSQWISPVVPVLKGDDVRVCIDMRRANEAVQRENHPLPTMEDFLPHLANCRFFAKLDVKNAFHQVRIYILYFKKKRETNNNLNGNYRSEFTSKSHI